MAEAVFEEVPRESVPLEVRMAGERALALCLRDLGLAEEVRISWIRPVPEWRAESWLAMEERMARLSGGEPKAWRGDRGLTGEARSLHLHEGRVRADQSPLDVVRIVAHELHHVHDFARYQWPRTEEEHALLEARAFRYEEGVAATFGERV
ncbi:MAG TPA: hypothetical protein VGR25_13225 [bacterium]|nr:hypothetical protein [bacterium]